VRYGHIQLRRPASCRAHNDDPAADHDDHASTDYHHRSTSDDNYDHGAGNDYHLTGDVDHRLVRFVTPWAPG
jgi:hypothetical protein